MVNKQSFSRLAKAGAKPRAWTHPWAARRARSAQVPPVSDKHPPL